MCIIKVNTKKFRNEILYEEKNNLELLELFGTVKTVKQFYRHKKFNEPQQNAKFFLCEIIVFFMLKFCGKKNFGIMASIFTFLNFLEIENILKKLKIARIDIFFFQSCKK